MDLEKLNKALEIIKKGNQCDRIGIDYSDPTLQTVVYNLYLLLEVFCETHGIDPEGIVSKSRKRENVLYRKIFIYCCRFLAGFSTVDLGIFLNMHHACVVILCGKTDDIIADKEYGIKIDKLFFEKWEISVQLFKNTNISRGTHSCYKRNKKPHLLTQMGSESYQKDVVETP